MLKLKRIKPELVASVYSGKAGRCCCGCAGKHSYATAHTEFAGKNRGYAVGPEEVSDVRVANVVKTLNANIADVTFEQGRLAEYACFETDTRLYVAYFVSEVTK